MLFDSTAKIISNLFFSDECLISDEFVKIMNDEDDRNSYWKGAEDARKMKKDVSIETKIGTVIISG